MAERKVMDVLRSRNCRYEVVRLGSGGMLSAFEFYVFRDGREIGGPYRDYAYAIDVAKKDGAR